MCVLATYHLISYQQQVPWVLGTKAVEPFDLTPIQPQRTDSAVPLCQLW